MKCSTPCRCRIYCCPKGGLPFVPRPAAYTVTYLPNGGTGGRVDGGLSLGDGYTIKTAAEAGVSREGFVFAGWNTRPDGGGTGYQPGAHITIEGSLVLYAQWTQAPTFYVEALEVEMGRSFRTVDATFSYGADAPIAGTGTVYYLLLKPGLPPPDAQTVIAFSDQTALADGTAARGQFSVAFGAGQTDMRALPGREVPAPYPDETGVVDGYRYVLYMAGQLGGQTTPVSEAGTSALGMPFEDALGTPAEPFGVRALSAAEMNQWPDLMPGHPINRAGVAETARMLDNIEGMVVLFEVTDGLYGLPDTLRDSYLLHSDFDLAGYAGAYAGAGWRPIGNANASLAGGGPEHVFTGTITTGGPRRVIANLRISETPDNTGVVAYAGLFGRARNAAIDGFDMTGAAVSASISDGVIGHAGALAGELIGDLAPMTITDATVSATGESPVDVGGVVGTLYSDACADISVLRVSCSATGGEATASGGICGHFVVEGSVTVSACTSVDGVCLSSRAAGGLFGALVFAASDSGGTISDVTASGTVTGGAFVGGIIGLLGGNPNRDPSACLVRDCAASADVGGYSFVGGLIGNVERATIQNASVLTGSIADTSAATTLSRPFGGLLGALNEGSAIGCTAAIDVLVPLSSRAGGLIGDLTTISADFSYGISNCAASGNVSAASYVGGLVGGYTTGQAPVTFSESYATGSVTGATSSGSTSSGGFIGSGQLARYTDCYATGTVQGRTNVGGFIGDSTAAQFTGCYARGNVTGAGTSVAGFIGSSGGAQFSRCFCTGNVAASSSNAGGFVSNFTGGSGISDCYAAGNCQGTGNVAGLVQAITGGSSIARCYASGSVNATAAAGGVVAAGSGSPPNPVSGDFALNPLVAGGASSVVGRVAASANALTLTNNSAISTLALTRGGVPATPTPGANLKDGATVTLAGLQSAMQAAGWSSSVWDFSTIATLGRPLLVSPRET